MNPYMETQTTTEQITRIIPLFLKTASAVSKRMPSLSSRLVSVYVIRSYIDCWIKSASVYECLLEV
ncbi:hypothetical protein BAOM_1874 [Peribacillus asahii]|uniref:Uncharacterized protein n=1 Tax=Peribacillus asahii TaxID=228899 RepID=A0A3T0KQJ4_9BACI|nr:hypothetical protein BAOM_1874 [Peribacillus asahii]